MDPNLENPFASIDHAHGRLVASPITTSPHHNYSASNHSQLQDAAENDDVFEEFVENRDDDMDRGNEIEEALDNRDREQENEDAARDAMKEFVKDP